MHSYDNKEIKWVGQKDKDSFSPSNYTGKNTDVQSDVLSIQYDHRGEYLAASYTNGEIKIIHPTSAKKMVDCSVKSLSEDLHDHAVSCVKFRPPVYDYQGDLENQQKLSKKQLLMVTCNGGIAHYDVHKGNVQHQMKVDNKSWLCCDFACDGLKFTVAGSDSKIYLYDEVTRTLITTMYQNGLKVPGHSSRVFCNKFLPDDPNVLITGGWDRLMKIYDCRIARPVGQIGGPLISGDCIDINGDEILTASNRQEKPLQIYSLSMRRKLVDIEWDNPTRRDHESGYLFGARFSKDEYRSVIFACGAGRNEAKVFDNDTEGNGKYREISHISDNSQAVLCCDTSPNGKQVAMGTSSGRIFVTSYSINKKGEEEDEMQFTMAQKLQAMKEIRQEANQQQ